MKYFCRMAKKEFTTVIKKLPDMDAAFIELPFDAEKVFGKKRMKIRVHFDSVLYRGTLMRMGMDCDWVGLNQDIRKKIGKGPGDTVHVTIEEDTEERIVEVSEEILSLFKKYPAEAAFFESLAFTHKKEYVRWITSAKRPETKLVRMAKLLEMLGNKQKPQF
jgi:hypothetical protein